VLSDNAAREPRRYTRSESGRISLRVVTEPIREDETIYSVVGTVRLVLALLGDRASEIISRLPIYHAADLMDSNAA